MSAELGVRLLHKPLLPERVSAADIEGRLGVRDGHLGMGGAFWLCIDFCSAPHPVAALANASARKLPSSSELAFWCAGIQ